MERFPTLTAARLFDMVKARGYTGGPDHFRHRIAQLRPRRPREAYLRLRTLAGEQAQVDWAHFGKLTIGRAERPLMAFVLVLSYSRYPFVRFYLGASLANLIRGHVEAFSVLGGTAKVLLYDNMKSVVLERRGDAIRFHPTLLELAAHYRFEPRPLAEMRRGEWSDLSDLPAKASSAPGASATSTTSMSRPTSGATPAPPSAPVPRTPNAPSPRCNA